MRIKGCLANNLTRNLKYVVNSAGSKNGKPLVEDSQSSKILATKSGESTVMAETK